MSCVLIVQNDIFTFSGYSWRFDDHDFTFHNSVTFAQSGKKCCMGKYRPNFLQDYSELKRNSSFVLKHMNVYSYNTNSKSKKIAKTMISIHFKVQNCQVVLPIHVNVT